ncbi:MULTISPECIES: cell wall hydrolase [Clostridia]|jgi:peptidoglycan DL-endopeptidase CwlO|uniref:cell wall hydrolase n=1 Tax=Clostridia TaxID=186801 RepID=UPI000E541D36|nr:MULTISPECIES: cell wall hydrolase [Clostridia]RHV06041.1 cell wall hydrolase [Firmicutes bacterium OM07-11]RKQ26978.1 cell wall hydrolase [Ruminococcus sp. B05]TAP33433.1 cell wall hydrolase [Mediterraneibacter sp. gm002]
MNLHTKRRLKAGVALLCSATMTFALATPYSFADEKETLENKTSDLQSQLAGINQDLLKISDEISNTQMRVTIVNSEILRSEDELAISQQNEDQQYENMKSRIKYMYENGNSSMLELLFSAESMSDFLNKADFIQNISQYDRDMLSELQNIHADIENQKMALQNQQDSLNNLENELQQQQAALQQKADETSTDLAQFQAQLQQIREQEAAKAAAEAAAKAQQEAAAKAQQQAQASANASSSGNNTSSNTTTSNGSSNSGNNSSGGVINNGGTSASKSDLDLLAAIIQCEAYQNYDSLLAVATVIMNRVYDSRFPNSISGVVYAAGQFEPAFSGRLEYVLNAGPTSLSYQVAQDAINGARLAEVADCYYFLYAGTGHPGINIGGNVFFPSW